jgi:hypothetical protein
MLIGRFTILTPLVPPLKQAYWWRPEYLLFERGKYKKRGFTPLRRPVISRECVSERGLRPLSNPLPLSKQTVKLFRQYYGLERVSGVEVF